MIEREEAGMEKKSSGRTTLIEGAASGLSLPPVASRRRRRSKGLLTAVQKSAEGIVGQAVGKASEALQSRKAEQQIGRAGNVAKQSDLKKKIKHLFRALARGLFEGAMDPPTPRQGTLPGSRVVRVSQVQKQDIIQFDAAIDRFVDELSDVPLEKLVSGLVAVVDDLKSRRNINVRGGLNIFAEQDAKVFDREIEPLIKEEVDEISSESQLVNFSVDVPLLLRPRHMS
jgi:hypothetical protein